MSGDLGEFEGLPVISQTIALKGCGDGLSKALAVRPVHIEKGETVDLLIRARAGSVAFNPHKDNADAWVRQNTLTAETITIVDREFAQDRIAAQEEANDKAAGKRKLPIGKPLDRGDIVHADENGVVLTPAEVAERQGLGLPVVTKIPACVVVFADGSRLMWPDDFGKGAECPQLGDEGSSHGYVADLLDAETGASVFPARDPEGGEGQSDGSPPSDEAWEASARERDDDDPPLVADLTFVDNKVGAVVEVVAASSDAAYLRRLLKAERQRYDGKGRNTVVRQITQRLEILGRQS